MSSYSKRQLTIYVILSIGNVSVSLCYSLQAPFFPKVAEEKGATPSQYGLVFGAFELVAFIMCPILGNYISLIGEKFMCTAGLFLTGGSCALFGSLEKFTNLEAFLGFAFAIRIMESFGYSAFYTSYYSIISKEFPDNPASVFATMEIFYGLGLILGPTLGGALYSIGGFVLPFAFLGSTLLIITLLSYCILPGDRTAEGAIAYGSIKAALKIKSVLLMFYTGAVAMMSYGCIQVGLEPHLRPFNLGPFYVGLIFVASGVMYSITSPLCGRLIDKCLPPRIAVIIGGIFMTISFLLLGPAPFFPFTPTLWVTTLALMLQGIAMGAEWVGCYIAAQRDAILNGMPDNISTFGIIAGLFMSTVSLGGFVGPSVIGYLIDEFGFRWATQLIVVLHLIVVIVSVVYEYSERFSKQKKEEQISINNRNYCTFS